MGNYPRVCQDKKYIYSVIAQNAELSNIQFNSIVFIMSNYYNRNDLTHRHFTDSSDCSVQLTATDFCNNHELASQHCLLSFFTDGIFAVDIKSDMTGVQRDSPWCQQSSGHSWSCVMSPSHPGLLWFVSKNHFHPLSSPTLTFFLTFLSNYSFSAAYWVYLSTCRHFDE